MPYATISDVFARYKPLSTMVGNNSYDVSSKQVSSAFIADAEGFVDAYISARYVTPLTAPVPPLIRQITADIAIFNMVVEKMPNVPDFMQPRYDRNMEILKMLRDGDMLLPTSSTMVSTGDQEVWSNNQDFHSIFSPVLTELDQAADDDQVRKERDDRIDDTGVSDVCPQ